MNHPNPSIALARTLIDELARGGVGLVVISPGSRSAALAIAAWEHPGIETRVVLDERSAAFFALGRAKATDLPTAVISTSGTAPANFLPAVVEADLALTPLVVMSADRPVELVGVGANQTIDQRFLYGNKVRRFAHLPAPGPGETPDLNHDWRSVAAEMVARARGWSGRPGPVHLNIAFREPTAPVTDDGRSRADPYPHPTDGLRSGETWLSLPPSAAPEPPDLDFGEPRRPLLVVGEGGQDGDALQQEIERLGWPVLATALSGVRGKGSVVTTYHHLLSAGPPARLRPDLVVAVGAIGPSTRLEQLVSSAPVSVRVDRWGRRLDPGRAAAHVVHARPEDLLALLPAGTEAGWKESWSEADAGARRRMRAALAAAGEPSGAGTVATLDRLEWETLVAASSLPIREVDAHLRRGGRVIGNRGASGIDGFVSTARGVASAGSRTLAVAGDLSLLHDQNGLLGDEADDLVLVVLDNGGGGLFDSLPHAQHAPDYERLFAAPQRRDFELLARFHGIPAVTAGDDLASVVAAALDAGGLHIVPVPIDRKFDLELRQTLDQAGAAT